MIRLLLNWCNGFNSKTIVLIFHIRKRRQKVHNKLYYTENSVVGLKYETTEKIDGQYVTRSIEKDGPTGFFTTTTKPQLFDENETRTFSLFVNESEEQTKKILMTHISHPKMEE